MANIELTNGERYTFAKQGTVTVITDSTDSAESTKFINNNLTLSGSDARRLLIETSDTTNDAYVHFKSDTTQFTAGIKGNGDSFTISKNATLTSPGNSSTALRIPNIASPKVHFDHGIVVTGSLDIVDTVRYSGEIYSEYTFTAAGNYNSGTWYDVVNSSQLVEGIYIIQGYVDTHLAGSYIYNHKFVTIPFYWYDGDGTNDTTVTSLSASIGSGHARNAKPLPTFQLKPTNSATDGKLYLQFNPGADNWTGINSTGGKTFKAYLKRIG